MVISISSQADYCEGNADGAFTQGSVKLQSLQPDPESGAQDASQYAAVYQALDPKTADWVGSFCFWADASPHFFLCALSNKFQKFE